ncbi:MAG TPA: gamma-glutamyltransferase [Rhizobium sp.]
MGNSLAISPHPEATALGNRLLAEGSSAAEAAVAMGAYLSVAMPHFCGLGGDAVWMTTDAGGRVRSLTGIGHAFAFADRISQIEQRGPRSILTSAAAVSTWAAALSLSGVSAPDLARLLGPARQAARDGIEVTPSQEFWRAMRAPESATWLGFSRYNEASTGSLLKQPALAQSLEVLMEEGLHSFYTGTLAERIRADLADIGVVVAADDLKATSCEVGDGLSLPYRNVTLHAPPLPTQGVTTLEIMGILDRLGRPETAVDNYHLMVEAVKCAFLDRQQIDDSGQAAHLPSLLLSAEHLTSRANEVDRARAREWPHVFQAADTVYFAARDQAGRCVSALQSTYFDWGSGCCLDRSGIIWHNRGASFSLKAGPNRLAPGRRPFHTLNPGIALKDGKPWLLYGTQGADGQPQTLTVLLRHCIDLDMAPAEALAAPRFLLGRTFSDSRDTLKLEPTGFEAELLEKGHDISPLSPLSPLAGQAGIIRIENDLPQGGHDPRKSL